MTIKVDLRAEAHAEAGRIRAVKAQQAVMSVRPMSGIPAAVLRRATSAGLRRSVAIFFTRTHIVDGSGRLVEELMIPVEVGSDVGGQPQEIFNRWHTLVRSVCLAEIAKRLRDLASTHRHGLERALARQSKIAEMARAHRDAPLHPGLFDGRVIKRGAATADHERQTSLNTASSLLMAQRSETVLLLIIR